MDVPLGNKTALRNEMYRGWMSAPDTRSTTDILWTCIATIILCVYTAVHLNIPEPGERKRKQALRRAKWITIAIFAPEVVLQSAWKQYYDARGLRDSLRARLRSYRLDHIGQTDPNSHLLQPKQNTLMADMSIEDLPEESDITMVYCFYAIMGGFRIKVTEGSQKGRSFTLTPAAIDEFAALGFFWDIKTSAIQDKSKQDTLAKLLTVIQVGWMLVQCSARKVASLPLTLIEVHTFIHAVCAVAMFVIWFEKPLDVRDATVKASTSTVHDLVYKLFDQADLNDQRSRLTRRRVNYGRDRLGDLSILDRADAMTAIDFGLDPIFDTQDDLMGAWTLLGILIIQVVYGCLHMIAWNSHFPSVLEKWFWRASCIAIASSMVISFVYFLIMLMPDSWAERKMAEYNQTTKRRTWDPAYLFCKLVLEAVPFFWVTVSVLLLSASLVARGFIVTESLISLRSVPIGVYASVPWSNYIPHL